MNINQIEEYINTIKGLRNDARQKAINETALMLHNYLKENGYIIVERDFLKTFFTGLESNTTINDTLKDVLNYLISNNKLEITFKYKNCFRFQRKPLFCFEDSYAEILKKGFCDCNNNKSIVKTNSKYKITATAYKVL